MDQNTKAMLRDYAGTVLIAVLVALAIRLFAVEAYRIPSSAMRPTLEPGDTIFVSKSAYGLRWPGATEPFTRGTPPARGDVAVFSYSTPGESPRDYIKRIVGLPGDEIAVQAGHLFVNGKPAGATTASGTSPVPANCAPEALARDASAAERVPYTVCFEPPLIEDTPATKVPPGSVFVLGDFRSNNGSDPRKTLLRNGGLVPIGNLKARALWTWLSVRPTSGTSEGWFPQFRFDRMFKEIK